MRQVRVFFHDHCFDGAASAAVFTAFYRQRIQPADFSYHGLTHKPQGLFDTAEFCADDNAIVDFKYSSDPRVTWWFDHHQSAFLSPADAEHFRAERSPQKFYDPNYGSCTRFIADVTAERFQFDPRAYRELIDWADTIDRADFPSAEMAVRLEEPALQLALAIEASTTPRLIPRLIGDFGRLPLAELVQQPYVRQELAPLLARHWRSLELIRGRIQGGDGVIYFDLSDLDLEGYNKFIPYFFNPQAVYSIGLSRSQYRMKVSVGSNPWKSVPDMVNLAVLCERYGGGGHARVGAISFAPGDVEAARRAAAEIVATLEASLGKRSSTESSS